MKVIINADDFGYSNEVNTAILQALRVNLISSTTLLPNMSGFEGAIAIAKAKEFSGRVGVHLNLFEGSPLTEEMKKCRTFSDELGRFHQQAIKFYEPLKVGRKVIYRELYAQIEKVINAGIIPTHLDSHAHRHTNFFIGSEVIKLAKHFKIPAIRISGNIRSSRVSNIKADLYNLRLKINGIKQVNYLGSIPEVTATLEKLNGTIEVISHPVYKEGHLTDMEYPGELAELLLPFLGNEIISYYDI